MNTDKNKLLFLQKKAMNIYTENTDFKIKNPVLTIGTYDGIHLGHAYIMEQLKLYAKKIGGESVVFSFGNHPRKFLFPEQNIELLHTNDEKIRKFEEIGLENLILHKFDEELSNLSYEEFIKTILIDKIGIKCLFVGFNHQFGKGREGNFENLQRLAKKYNFNVKKLEVFKVDGLQISSSKIRNALKNGEIEKANKCLGYNYSLTGKVVAGKQVGRKLGFPTANVFIELDKLIPQNGVYSVKVLVKNREYLGMLNIGYQPTIEQTDKKRRIEVNIFNFKKNIYGEEITVLLKKKIRNEKKFKNWATLKRQIIVDKKKIELLMQTKKTT